MPWQGFRSRIAYALLAIGCFAFSSGCASTRGRAAPDSGAGDTTLFQRMQADRALQAGRFDEAIRGYSQLIEETANDQTEPAIIRHRLAEALWKRAGRVNGEDASTDAGDSDRAAAIKHLREALDILETGSSVKADRYATIGRTLGRYLRAVGNVDEAISVYEHSLSKLPSDGEQRARTLHDLGAAYLVRSRRGSAQDSGDVGTVDDLTLATRQFDEALSISKQLQDAPPDLLVLIHNSMGLAYNERLQPGLAAERFSLALKLCQEHDIQSSMANVLENLIGALVEIGRNDEALARCTELEALPAAATDPKTMTALGKAYLALGDLARSRQQFDLARYMVREDTATTYDPTFMVQLACGAAAAAQAVGAYDEAERLLLDAIKELDTEGVDPRTSAVVQANLGRMYLTMERLDNADSQLNRALETSTKLHGPQHPDTLLLMLDLANLARSRGFLLEASELCEKAIRGLVPALGRDHPEVAAARLELASLWNDQGRCEEALQQAKRAMESLDARLGENDKRSVLACLKTALIAADCTASGENAEELRSLTDQASRRFRALRESLGTDNVEVLRVAVYFADVSAKSPAAHEAALRRYREAEKGFAKIYGDTTKSLAALRLKQGRMLERLGRQDEALKTCERALRLMDRSLMQSPIHAELLAAMADAYDAMGEQEQGTKRRREALRILTAVYGRQHPRVQQLRKTLSS